jgi:hypothetical protein
MPHNLEIPTDGITVPTTPNELGVFLSQFTLDESLRFIGEMSFEIQKDDPSVLWIDDVPITNGILTYIALKLISYSHNSQSKIVLDAKNLKKVFQI